MAVRFLNPRSKNIYSIRAIMSKANNHSYHVSGPWRATLEDAVKAFVEQLKKKGHDQCVFQCPFVGVRATVRDQIETQVHSDRNSVPYRVGTEFHDQIPGLLIAQGLKLPTYGQPEETT